jgi:kynurenine formamidase
VDVTLYDLSWPVESGMPTYPGDPRVAVRRAATMAEDGYRVSSLSLSTHAGTHVDAPSHLLAEGRSTGDYPVEAFRFDAVRVDCTGLDARTTIDPAALSAADPDPDADMLVVETGWATHYWTPTYRDHPYLSPAAADWCASRGYAVGVDAPSVDPSPGPGGEADPVYPAHHAILGADRPIVENLRGLDPLPERFTLHAYPLPVDADGAPVRAVGEADSRDGDPVSAGELDAAVDRAPDDAAWRDVGPAPDAGPAETEDAEEGAARRGDGDAA